MSFKQLKYYPELNEITGSVNATLTLLQLEYWFEKCKGNKFYKFLDRCEHERYREGDSWVEELRFTKHEFRSAFAKIGKAYKSKKLLMKVKMSLKADIMLLIMIASKVLHIILETMKP